MQNNVTACQNAKCFFTNTSIDVQCVYTRDNLLAVSPLQHPTTKCIYQGTTPTSSSPVSTPASTTAAWAHLRALRDTGNTCHGSPDLGEGSSRDHTCTNGMPRGDRTTGVHACGGTAEGVPHPVETNRPSE